MLTLGVGLVALRVLAPHGMALAVAHLAAGALLASGSSAGGLTVAPWQLLSRADRSLIVYRGPSDRKVVALTLDDGPSPVWTPKVLDLLNSRGVKATFFLVGRLASRNPDLVRREVSEGNAVGNHTWDHPHLEALSPRQVSVEFSECGALLKQLTGREPWLARPPRGAMAPAGLQAIVHAGYTPVLWSVATEHRDAHTPRQMADRVIAKTTPGAIILAHDGGRDQSRTLDALALIIDGLKAKGYTFVTVPELLKGRPLEGRSRA
ncbi:MAG TPA: polysaccharide deacetylase family protein [Armatimonadota bacterium]|jgi:peptidoglycan/xylan/chitin deacetylase (PgdA/CDA1 family)